MEIKKVLVANRGEIACRVIRSCKEMGIATVAVYSEPDRTALHVQAADEAWFIGPPAPSASYLNIEKIIEVCQKSGADAVHPGYGFLSENAAFAEAVEKAGIAFIGPSAEAIEVMGSKLAAKAAVSKYNIPLVPGTDKPVLNLEEAIQIARQVGFPLLIKASAGGGGKGMRLVEREDELNEQMERAINEAKSAFGDGSVFIEKFIASPKHIEFQIMGDKHGNIVHLFERECSVQRRHQKVIEEAPSAVLTPEVREAMGKCATDVARACGYYGAGTVEFLVDKQLNYYFLEMNTRLQVEHPVTELITGKDLVKEQIRIAEGKELSLKQHELSIYGHAVEVRVYAEDPANNFLPDTGKLHVYQRPQGPGVRVDDGYSQGMDIPVYYDPMIAKLVTWGENRQEAVKRMLRAIEEYKINGIATTLPFCHFALQHPEFTSGRFTTKFVEQFFTPDKLQPAKPDPELCSVAALLVNYLMQEKHLLPANGNQQQKSEKLANGTAKKKWKTNRLQNS